MQQILHPLSGYQHQAASRDLYFPSNEEGGAKERW